MYVKTLGLATAVAFGFSGVAASAATLLIDGFDTDQRVIDVPGPGLVNSSEIAGPAILGGFREMSTATQGGSVDATELRVAGSNLSFSNITGVQGSGVITYDGVGATGLGGIDFTLGGSNPFFAFEIIDFDRDVEISVDVRDTNGLTATYFESLSGGFSPNLSFTQFTLDAGFDFTSVDALSFLVSSLNTQTAVDGAIGSIRIEATPVPLPASALLLLGGIGGLTALRRRKNKSA